MGESPRKMRKLVTDRHVSRQDPNQNRRKFLNAMLKMEEMRFIVLIKILYNKVDDELQLSEES